MSAPGTLAPVRDAFRAVAVACVPTAAGLSEDAWARAEAVVDRTLAQRTPGVRRQVVLFARVLRVLARIRYARSLARLGPDRTRALLTSLERSPLLLLRRGTWGLRTLAFMGVYTQEETRTALGYRAGAAGWRVRGGGQGAWPDRAGTAPPEAQTLVAGDDGHDGDGGGVATGSAHA
jgi:hypothetical protein